MKGDLPYSAGKENHLGVESLCIILYPVVSPDTLGQEPGVSMPAQVMIRDVAIHSSSISSYCFPAYPPSLS